MDTVRIERVLREHKRLCGDLHELLLEEGRIMRSAGRPPDKSFLNRKKEFLPALEKGKELLREINEDSKNFPPNLEPLVREARAFLIKLMILDRENERLLLKSSLPPKMKQAYAKALPKQLVHSYEKFGPR